MSEGGACPVDWEAFVPRLVHPMKVAIVEALEWIGTPLSATDLVKVLDHCCNISGASYHLKSLAKIGVVEGVSERQVRGAHEKFYFFAPGARSCLSGELNHVLLSGVVLDEPQEHQDRSGARVTLLQVGFTAPGAAHGDPWPSACCEVEIPIDTPGRRPGDLRPGTPVLVTGRLGGGAGGVVATLVSASPPA